MRSTQEQLIDDARRIASHQGYPHLINGLQPVHDYDDPETGRRRLGLLSKYHHELEELEQEQRRGEHTIWELLEAADVLYYAAQLAEQEEPIWWEDAQNKLSVNRFEDVECVALLKYGWRSQRPGNKDHDYEYSLARQALSGP